jgi:hypothetical protein
MGELLAVTCDSCGEPMVSNVSTLDADGCGWICLSPGCPELPAGELEAEDLVEAGVPEALAGRLARLVDHYVDAEEARGREADAPAGRVGRAQAELARLHALLLELGRLAEGAGALALSREFLAPLGVTQAALVELAVATYYIVTRFQNVTELHIE